MNRKHNKSDAGHPINGDGSESMGDFERSFGENFSNAIDIDTWRMGEDLAELYSKIEKELAEVKQDEGKHRQIIRNVVFPRIRELQKVPGAGVHRIKDESLIEKIHRGFLFNGAVTACGSVSAAYQTVPISIMQIAVCLVNYLGQQGSYSHQMYRRDLRAKSNDPIKDALELIERRRRDGSAGMNRAKLSSLAIRGIRAYAERAILLEKSGSNWLLGSGSPTPYELMTGFWASRTEMKNRSIALMSKLVLDHSRFVYVQTTNDNGELWTMGNALDPFEYLLFDNLEEDLIYMVESGGTRGEFERDYLKFSHDVGPKIAIGLYKISRQAPPKIFYCHVDHIQVAVLIAMADSALQSNQGSPMLLDLANQLCQNAFGKNDFLASIEQAYINADISLQIES
jgi:hypothetical protein